MYMHLIVFTRTSVRVMINRIRTHRPPKKALTRQPIINKKMVFALYHRQSRQLL
jgi:hypothetical protein